MHRMFGISLMLHLLAVALLCATGALQSLQQNSSAIGATVKVTLSDYSNPHQVLADTGYACDTRSFCDPYFIVKLGTYRHSFRQEARSETFNNRYNISGEFYNAEFQLSQEIPGTLLIGVSIMDEDTVMDPMPYQIIAEPHAVELQHLMPSFPGGDNAVRRDIVWTPDNRNVRFTLKVEAFCWPGLYGKTCGAHCDGELAYPSCDLPVGDARCSSNGRVIGCQTAGASPAGASMGQGNSWLDVLAGNYMAIGLIGGVAVIVAIIAVVSLVLIRRKRHARALIMDEYRSRIANQRLSCQDQQQQQQHQQPSTTSTTLESAPMMSLKQSFKNPVYTGGTVQPQAAMMAAERHEGAANSQHQQDSSCTDQEVYEDIDEQPGGQGDLPPLLPPRVATVAERQAQ